MKDISEEPQYLVRLALEKHGLSYLLGKNILTVLSSDIDRFLNALASEDLSAIIPISAKPQNIVNLLSQSKCRNCGRCCLPDPCHRGVEVFEDELKAIQRHYHISHKYLKKITSTGQLLQHPERAEVKGKTRWLPLPCPFFNKEIKKCKIYELRPIACKIFPITMRGSDESHLEIEINCDYGKDLFKSAIQSFKEKKENFIWVIS